jgi:cell division septation protein DedD
VSREDSTITPERGPERYQDQTRQDSASRDTVTLVPAAERPPEPYSELPLNAEITPITSPALTSIETAPVQTADRDEIPESLIIAGIPAERPGTPVQTPAEEPVRNEAASFDREEPVSPGTAPVLFSAAVINTLEKGKYYLQLGAFSKPDLVESELSRIGNTYPLAVQAGGSPEKPLYRILVGPVNLGESNALLQRFKGNGYQDAFVRKDG